MGLFLAVSAFRTSDSEKIRNAVVSYCERHQVPVEASSGGEPSPRTDASFYAAENGWVRILWPDYFNTHDFPLCERLADDLGIDVSTVHVYEGDFWEHLFLRGGEKIHFFCSWPNYFGEDEPPTVDVSVPRDPELLCQRLGIDPASVENYFQTFPFPDESPPESPRRFLAFFRKPKKPEPVTRKAYPSDEFDLGNIWVFADFWRKLGIHYPDPGGSRVAVLRFDKSTMHDLPTM